MGDLNWDFLETTSAGYKMIMEICDEFSLTQEVTKPTRITQQSCTLIDVILTNVRNINYAGCVNYNISEHCPVVVVKKGLQWRENMNM